MDGGTVSGNIMSNLNSTLERHGGGLMGAMLGGTVSNNAVISTDIAISSSAMELLLVDW